MEMKPRLYQRTNLIDPDYKHYEWFDKTNRKLHQVRINVSEHTMTVQMRSGGGVYFTEEEARESAESAKYQTTYHGIDYIRMLANAIEDEN